MKVQALNIAGEDRTAILKAFQQFVIPDIVCCWEWSGKKRSGYASLVLPGGKSAWAHRISYALFIGSIPEDIVIDHKCRHRGCVNPEHLLAVTHQVNCNLIRIREEREVQHNLLNIQILDPVFIL